MRSAQRKCLALITLLLIWGHLSPAQTRRTTISQKFFEVDQDIKSLREEMAEVRKQMREIELRTSVPQIRKEINKLIDVPELTHEILLKNGTIVKGKIIFEDLNRVIVQTQIGQLTISKNNIQLTREADLPKAICKVVGSVKEEVYDDKRVFSGKIQNEGVRRADFPRIAFYLYDENTELVAADSTFIQGNYHMYKSGVQTDATIDPGQTFDFKCTVAVPEGSAVSYYIKEITWEEFN